METTFCKEHINAYINSLVDIHESIYSIYFTFVCHSSCNDAFISYPCVHFMQKGPASPTSRACNTR